MLAFRNPRARPRAGYAAQRPLTCERRVAGKVGDGVDREAFLEALLASRGVTAAALAQLQFPAGERLETRLQRALLKSERESLDFLESSSLGPPPGRTGDPIDRPFLLAIGVLCTEPWTAEVERYYDDVWTALYAPPAERFARMRQLRARLFEAVPFWKNRDQWLLRAVDARLRAEAETVTAETGVALMRYRLSQGKWPERLDELPAPVPSDPFTGAPSVPAKTDGRGGVDLGWRRVHGASADLTFRSRPGLGEYDPFVHVNRVLIDAESAHPYDCSTGTCWLGRHSEAGLLPPTRGARPRASRTASARIGTWCLRCTH